MLVKGATGGKAPDLQYPQGWLNVLCVGLIPCSDVTFIVNNIDGWNYILKKKKQEKKNNLTQLFKGLSLVLYCVAEFGQL